MIMAGPGIKAGHEVDNACSLVDPLPTMLDMASVDGTSARIWYAHRWPKPFAGCAG